MKKFDYFIVGQGLDGSVLAWKLSQRKKSICLIDNPVFNSASRVAAGMYNPIVFKRITKGWLIDSLLPVMRDFYGD
jgi:glycine/D-amino acid oxidase-like deaminating enzyme